MKTLARSGLVVLAAVLAAVAIAYLSPASYSARAIVILQIESNERSGPYDYAALSSAAFTAATAAAKSDAALAPAAVLAKLPIDKVRGMVSVSPVTDSLKLDITANSSSPTLAADMANSVANTISSQGFISQDESVRSTAVRAAEAPAAPQPLPWFKVLMSGLLAGVVIVISLEVTGWKKRAPKKKQPDAPALAHT